MYKCRRKNTAVRSSLTAEIEVLNIRNPVYLNVNGQILSVLKSHFDSACMTVLKQLLGKSEKRFVGTHWLQEELGLSEEL